MLVVGVKCFRKYDNEVHYLGIVFILYPILSIVANIIIGMCFENIKLYSSLAEIFLDIILYERLAHTLTDAQIF